LAQDKKLIGVACGIRTLLLKYHDLTKYNKLSDNKNKNNNKNSEATNLEECTNFFVLVWIIKILSQVLRPQEMP
jgi:hypothetical protein